MGFICDIKLDSLWGCACLIQVFVRVSHDFVISFVRLASLNLIGSLFALLVFILCSFVFVTIVFVRNPVFFKLLVIFDILFVIF
jgi:hypothetical protein